MQIQQTGGKDNAGKAKHAIWKMAAESYRILCGIYCRRPAALLCTGQAAWIIRRNVFKFADVEAGIDKDPCLATLADLTQRFDDRRCEHAEITMFELFQANESVDFFL